MDLRIWSDEKGVSEVIGSVLILTIIVAFLGIMQAYYVPKWNNDVEAGHFDKIYDDVLDLKRIMQDTAVYDLPRTAVIHASLHYPERMFLLNPPGPSGMITMRPDKEVILTYNNNITEKMNSCTVRISEGYNYFNAPALVIEHDMIVGEYGKKSYMIDEPLLSGANIDLMLVDCGNYSLGTMSSYDIRIYPSKHGNIIAGNASLTFDTDYPDIWKGYLNSIGANFTTSGNKVTVLYNNMTKIRVMGIKIMDTSSFSIMPQASGTILLESFETVGDKGYSSSGSGSYELNANRMFVTNLSGSLAMSYDFKSKNGNDKLVVDINYNRYTPQRTFNLTGFTSLKLDIYGDNSGQNTSIAIRGGSATYEWQPITVNWEGWNTVSLPLSKATEGGVDINAIEMVLIKISETGAMKNTGTIYYDYLRGEN